MKLVLDTNIYISSFIITGDNDLLIIKEFRGIKIISANEYINILKAI